MSTKKPRVNVTFDEPDFRILSMLSKQRKSSISAVVRTATQNWIEENEDFDLYETLKKREREKSISEEEFWNLHGIL